MRQILCTIYSLFVFAHTDLWYLNIFLAVLHGNSFFNMRSVCELPHYMLLSRCFQRFLNCLAFLTWQFQPSTFAFEYVTTHFLYEDRVWVTTLYVATLYVTTIYGNLVLFATFNWAFVASTFCWVATAYFILSFSPWHFCFVLTSAEWLAVIIKTMMMISWSYRGRIVQLDGQQTTMR